MKGARFALLVALLGAACSGPASPTASSTTVTTPSVDRVVLPTGAYDFFAFQSNPPAECGVAPGIGSPLAALNSHIILSHEGAEWVARATSAADGDLEIRFHDTGGTILSIPNSPVFVPVSTTIRGSAIAPALFAGGDSTTVVVDSLASTVPGSASAIVTGATTIIVLGQSDFGGTMTIRNAQGSHTCHVVMSWSITKPFF